MSEAKHTPGPWEIEKYGDKTGSWYSIDALMAGRFGTVADTLNRDCAIDPDEDRANAELIAAAPDLLAAALVVVDYLHDYACQDGNIAAQGAVADLEAAIAKAKSSPPAGRPK